MKLLEILQSRTAYLQRLNRPEGPSYLPFLLAAVADRYGFVDYPNPSDIIKHPGNGAVFNHGHFNQIAFSMTIYEDGLILESASDSAFLDEVHADIIDWASSEFNIQQIDYSDTVRNYESAIVVECQEDILDEFQMVSRLKSALADKLFEVNGVRAEYDFFGFSLAVDPAKAAGVKPAVFKFERRVSSSFSKNHFFSTAPLPTSGHLQFLREFEETVKRVF